MYASSDCGPSCAAVLRNDSRSAKAKNSIMRIAPSPSVSISENHARSCASVRGGCCGIEVCTSARNSSKSRLPSPLTSAAITSVTIWRICRSVFSAVARTGMNER